MYPFILFTPIWNDTPILWPPDAKSWLIGKDSDAGKDWRWEEKGMTEEEVVGWHHQLNGHEFEQTPGGSEDGEPGVLQSTGSQGVRQNLAAEQQALSSTRNHKKCLFKRCSDHSHPCCKSWPKFYARCHSWGVKGGSGKRRGGWRKIQLRDTS